MDYQLCHSGFRASAVELRKQITDLIQEKMYELKVHAETFHSEWTMETLK